MSPAETELIEQAAAFAIEAHKGAMRKGGDLPYIIHPLEALSIVSRMTNDPEVMAAAVLHDIIEDTDHTVDELRERFGDRVADLVLWESEDKRRDLPASETWKIRKEETIARDKDAPIEVKILLLADKLSNMRGSLEDYRAHGDAMWQKFNMKDKSQQAWYYRSIAQIVPELKDTTAYKEYILIIDEIFGDVP